MSIKIKISYETPQELQAVLCALKPLGITWKQPKQQNGPYRNAYVKVKQDLDTYGTAL